VTDIAVMTLWAWIHQNRKPQKNIHVKCEQFFVSRRCFNTARLDKNVVCGSCSQSSIVSGFRLNHQIRQSGVPFLCAYFSYLCGAQEFLWCVTWFYSLKLLVSHKFCPNYSMSTCYHYGGLIIVHYYQR